MSGDTDRWSNMRTSSCERIRTARILRLKDVAKVELGSEFFDIYSDIDGHPAASIVLKQAPNSNASAVIDDVAENSTPSRRNRSCRE
ncbi:MAG: efflux RND transporter permease subunit [Phycisphaerae bacterium]